MDSLPRVPDTHGDVVDEKLFSDLYIRTSWVDAHVALDQIDKVSAKKRTVSLLQKLKENSLLLAETQWENIRDFCKLQFFHRNSKI